MFLNVILRGELVNPEESHHRKPTRHSERVKRSEESRDFVWRDSSPHKGVQNDVFFIKNIFRHPEAKPKDLPE